VPDVKTYQRGDIDRQTGASPAGLTRGSIVLRKKLFAKEMDGRVKPGHDGSGLPGDLVIEVAPVGIHREDEINLPLSRPMLDVLFPLDRSGSRVVAFVINQH
jgi:hypothetical protein